MGKINVERCYTPEGLEIEGLRVISPTVHRDSRGYFVETYNLADMAAEGLNMNFVQDNQSHSAKGVLRGLHYQKQFPQGKLVRAIRGSVFDVAVDLRRDSATYGKWYGVVLSEDNFRQFYVPEGFAHGYLVMTESATFCYKVTDFYHPGDEGGLQWNDPEIGIRWPEVEGDHLTDGTPLLLNDRDQNWPGLREAFFFR